MLTDPSGRKLPTGVTYDPRRGRYRVRLYRGEHAIWLSYSRRYSTAMEQYRRAVSERNGTAQVPRGPSGRLRARLRAVGDRIRRWRDRRARSSAG